MNTTDSLNTTSKKVSPTEHQQQQQFFQAYASRNNTTRVFRVGFISIIIILSLVSLIFILVKNKRKIEQSSEQVSTLKSTIAVPVELTTVKKDILQEEIKLKQEMTSFVKVIKTILGKEQSEGAGARVIRTIGGSVSYHDPFLLLDEFKVAKPAGFPNHPHRGFETVTYMMNGAFEHKDNHGGGGVIHEGDIQWMTAGRGIIHSETPVGLNVNTGMQLWVNLKAQDKMVPPKYQDLKAENIPKKQIDEHTSIAVIGGKSQYAEIESPLELRTKVLYFDVKITKSGHTFTELIPKGYQGFVYIIKGSGVLTQDGEKFENAKEKAALLFSETTENQVFEFKSTSDFVQMVIIAGEPMHEPMSRYGPFVMNTRDEIEQAFEDYHNGKFF